MPNGLILQTSCNQGLTFKNSSRLWRAGDFIKVIPDLTQDRTVPISIRQELHNLPILVMLRFGGWGLISRRRKERLVRLEEELASKE